ncbi:MAG: GIY-YIG nuclease family protein [Flavobacteriales bacterium]|nr:GIY-YIG nuclease family protein [Flavobacteriales bacterium]
MHWVYVLYSSALERHYIGESEDPDTRLLQHRTGYFPKAYTAKADDWILRLKVQCPTIQVARQLESFIKRMRNRDFIDRFCDDEHYRRSLLADRFGIP